MELKTFLRKVTKQERAEVAAACNSSVGYLYQIAGGHRYASPLMATRIERHTRRVVGRSGLRLAVVPRTSLVRHPEIFHAVGRLNGVTAGMAVGGAGQHATFENIASHDH